MLDCLALLESFAVQILTIMVIQGAAIQDRMRMLPLATHVALKLSTNTPQHDMQVIAESIAPPGCQ